MKERIVGNVLRYSYESENNVQPVPSIVDLFSCLDVFPAGGTRRQARKMMQWQSDSFPPAHVPPESIATIRADEATVLVCLADYFRKNLGPAAQSNF